MIREDFVYKVVAVITALTLWLYVQGEQNPRIAPNIPGVQLQVLNIPKGYSITGGTGELSVTLEGTKSSVDGIRREKLRAWVDLAGRGPGTMTVPVQVTLPKSAPEDVVATPVPSAVTMTLEAVATRVMSVDVNYITPPPVGYNLGEPKVSPASAYISGRSALVEQVRRLAVMVDPSQISNPDEVVDSYFDIAALDASGNEVKDVTIDPDRTRVRLGIVRVPATKLVIVSPTFVGQPKFGYLVKKVTVRPSEVMVKGQPEILYNISTIMTEDVDVDGATSTIAKDVGLRVPSGITVANIKTVRVTAKIEVKEGP